MSENERRDHLLRAADNLVWQSETWLNSSDKMLSDTLASAVEDCLVIFGEGAIPSDLRDLTARVAELAPVWAEYQDRTDRLGDETLPSRGFWHVVEKIGRSRLAIEQARRPRPLETLEQLEKQRVSDAQICRIYGWVEADGGPQMWKLEEERANPGRHTKDVKSTAERAGEDRLKKREAALVRLSQSALSKTERLTAEPPEGFASLVRQGVSAKQLARQFHCSVEEVYARCDAEGLSRPELTYPSLNATKGAHDRDVAAEVEEVLEVVEEAEPAAEEVTIEQRVIALHRQGVDRAAIRAQTGVDGRKVGAIIRRYEQNPEVFS